MTIPAVSSGRPGGPLAGFQRVRSTLVVLPTILVALSVHVEASCAQVVGPPDPRPEIEAGLELEDEILGIGIGGSFGAVSMGGAASERLQRGMGGHLFIGAEFESVRDVRVGVSWAETPDPISSTDATIGSLYLELMWALVERRVILQAGPRIAWYRMERTWWTDGTRSTLGGGGVAMLLVPVGSTLAIEASLSLTSFTLRDPILPVHQDDSPALERSLGLGVRYRLR